MIDYNLVSKALIHLENAGWSDLIDKRWKSNVSREITENFPEINKETLNHVLDCVLI